MADDRERSAPALMGDLVTHVTELVRKEIQLLRAEMSEKTSQAIVAIGTVAGAVVLALTALNVLAAALVGALTEAGVPAVWSAVIVGGALALIALLMARGGIASLKASSLAPERTVRSASRDAAMVKEKV
jgi:Putative Actinobacterial Holin-X, holin superfamily III